MGAWSILFPQIKPLFCLVEALLQAPPPLCFCPPLPRGNPGGLQLSGESWGGWGGGGLNSGSETGTRHQDHRHPSPGLSQNKDRLGAPERENPEATGSQDRSPRLCARSEHPREKQCHSRQGRRTGREKDSQAGSGRVYYKIMSTNLGRKDPCSPCNAPPHRPLWALRSAGPPPGGLGTGRV